MIIKTFIEPPLDNNNYLIIDEISGEAALIDCSFFDKNIFEELKTGNYKLKYVLLTHGHFDHIGGLNDIPAGVEVMVHEADMEWINNVNNYLPMIGMPGMEVPVITKFFEDGDIIVLGSINIKVIHTPGHTQGGVCFYAEGNLFTGDTIFRESVGRCDLPGGNFNQIIKSIENNIFTLPECTTIYPGHGKSSTVGWEKENNKFL